MRQGIDITDVESETKIRAKFLRSLENEEWDLVGDDTLVRSFLRTYAEHLGLDPKGISESYALERQGGDAVPGHGSLGLDRSSAGTSTALRWSVAVGLLVLAAVLLAIGSSH